MMAYLKKIADMARRIALAGMMVMGAAVAAGAEPGLRLHYDRPGASALPYMVGRRMTDSHSMTSPSGRGSLIL